MNEDKEEIILKHLFPKTFYTGKDYEPMTLVDLDGKENPFPKLLFLVKDNGEGGFKENEIELLKKMVDWIGIKRNEVAVLNAPEGPVSFLRLRSFHRVENIICY